MEQISQRDDTVNHGTDQSKGLMLLTDIRTNKINAGQICGQDRIKAGECKSINKSEYLERITTEAKNCQK